MENNTVTDQPRGETPDESTSRFMDVVAACLHGKYTAYVLVAGKSTGEIDLIGNGGRWQAAGLVNWATNELRKQDE